VTRIKSPEAIMHTLLQALEHDASLDYHIKSVIASEASRMAHGMHMDRAERKLPIDVQEKRALATRITNIKDVHPDGERKSASGIIHSMDILAAVVDGIGTTQSTLSSLAEAGSMLNKLWQLVTLSDLTGGVDIAKAVYDAVISHRLKQWYAIVLFVQHLRDRMVYGGGRGELQPGAIMNQLRSIASTYAKKNWRIVYAVVIALADIGDSSSDAGITRAVLFNNDDNTLWGLEYFIRYDQFSKFSFSKLRADERQPNSRIREAALESLWRLTLHQDEKVAGYCSNMLAEYPSKHAEVCKAWETSAVGDAGQLLAMHQALLQDWSVYDDAPAAADMIESRRHKKLCADIKSQLEGMQKIILEQFEQYGNELAQVKQLLDDHSNDDERMREYLEQHADQVRAQLSDTHESLDSCQQEMREMGKALKQLQAQSADANEFQDRVLQHLQQFEPSWTAELVESVRGDAAQDRKELESNVKQWIRDSLEELKVAANSAKLVDELEDLDSASTATLTQLLQSHDDAASARHEELQLQCDSLRDIIVNVVDSISKLQGNAEKIIDDIGQLVTRMHSRPTLESKLQAMQRFFANNDKNLNTDLEVYVPARGSLTDSSTDTDEKQRFDLDQYATNSFFAPDSKRRVLTIKAASGTGKSTFLKYMYRKLWQELDAAADSKTSLQHQWIPLLIPLGGFPDPEHGLIERALRQLTLSDDMIDTLKLNYRMVLLLDAYDESGSKQNLYVSNRLELWRHCKVVFTVRPEYTSQSRRLLQPYRDGRTLPGAYEEIHLCRFDDTQIRSYLRKMVQVQDVLWKDPDQYVDAIGAIPGLRDMIRTPFMLHMVGRVLPVVHERYKNDTMKQQHDSKKPGQAVSPAILVRNDIYDEFVKQWFEWQANRLFSMDGLMKRFGHLSEDFVDECENFCRQLASEMIEQGVSSADVSWLAPGNANKKKLRKFGRKARAAAEDVFVDADAKASPFFDFFDPADKELEFIRRGAPIRRSGNTVVFVHLSLVEYFAASHAFVDVVDALARGDMKHECTDADADAESNATGNHEPLRNTALGDVLLTSKPETIKFLAERVEREIMQATHDEQTSFTSGLWRMVHEARGTVCSMMQRISAANAMMILNAARVSFAQMDLSGIRIGGIPQQGDIR
jgi:hypothetical protein